MERKSLQYSDGKSDKFWIITLEGSEYRVRYGRSGTSGQTQTKTFDTETAAKQAYEKQISDKLKKGYVEIESEITQDSDPQPEHDQSDLTGDTKAKQSNPKTDRDPKPDPQITVQRSLNLSPLDWQWATWRPRDPLPRPEPKPFDLEKCLKQLRKTYKDEQFVYTNDWTQAQLSISMSPEEARFWFAAMTYDPPFPVRDFKVSDMIEDLRSRIYSGGLTLEDALAILSGNRRNIHVIGGIAVPLFALFGFMDVVVELHQLLDPDQDSFFEKHFRSEIDQTLSRSSHVWGTEQAIQFVAKEKRRNIQSTLLQRTLHNGFKHYLWPYLTDEEMDSMRSTLRPYLERSPGSNTLQRFAAYLGMHRELEKIIDGLTPIVSSAYSTGINENAFQLEVVLGVGSAEVLQEQVRNLRLAIDIDHMGGWLAHTEFSDLEWLGRSIKTEEALVKFASMIQAPEAAPIMLELWLTVKKSQKAREWLEDHPINTIVGLIPVVAGQVTPFNVKTKDLIQAAVRILSGLGRKGYDAQIRQVLSEYDQATQAAVHSALQLEEDLPLLDETTTPEWLSHHVQDLDRQMKKAKPGITWVSPEDLPRLSLGSHYLNDDQVQACLFACKQSTLDSPHPLLMDLKQHLRQDSLDVFIWALFERWLTEGGSSKEKWAMFTLGLLGSDAIALKLTPLIRSWPGESQHPRAVLGLECLRTIGSDVALMQINGIAQKIKYQGLKKRANECMEDIARQRNLSSEELEDRIIPDCGLDQQGQRLFDYGPRQFPFVLGLDLKPMIRDEKGKLKTNLPKPNSKDDPEQAEQAQADWKLMKKQMAELVKIQATRLELAMINNRCWSVDEFESLLVKHPLMTHLVQRLVWAGYDDSDQHLHLFRVAEDQTFANLEDDEVDLNSIRIVGIPHPIVLPEQERSAWSQVLSDYGIISPFPQIDREVYSPQPEEKQAREITRFTEMTPIDGVTLMRTLESLGWRKGDTDQGELMTYYKQFPRQDLTAFVGDFDLSYTIDFSMGSKEVIDGCCFMSGLQSSDRYPSEGNYHARLVQAMFPQVTPRQEQDPGTLLLENVDPIVFSETVRDLHILLSKQKDKS